MREISKLPPDLFGIERLATQAERWKTILCSSSLAQASAKKKKKKKEKKKKKKKEEEGRGRRRRRSFGSFGGSLKKTSNCLKGVQFIISNNKNRGALPRCSAALL